MRKTYARVLTGEQALEDRENYEMELRIWIESFYVKFSIAIDFIYRYDTT